VIDESEEQYARAISRALDPSQAKRCKDAVKKRNILQFLRETLAKQEQLLKEEIDQDDEIVHSLDEMREMIALEYQKIQQIMENCPD
jgi:hypothetical protein